MITAVILGYVGFGALACTIAAKGNRTTHLSDPYWNPLYD